MKYAVKIKYAVWHLSNWEVEASDEKTAEQMITRAFENGVEENANCHRTEPDSDMGLGPFEEIEKIEKVEA